MSTLNAIVRPPAENLVPEEIPEWTPGFFENAAPQLMVRLAFNPRGEDPPDLADRAGCDPELCEPLGDAELAGLWKAYASKGMGLDGIFKLRNPLGAFDVYVYRHGIHQWDDFLCKIPEGDLAVPLSRADAIVLEIWTSLRQTNFQACDVHQPSGAFLYKAVLNGQEERERLVAELELLQKALRWQKAHPSKSDNPFNPAGLPLNISPERLEGVSAEFRADLRRESFWWWGGGAVALLSPFWLGVGFHYGPVWAGRIAALFARGGAALFPLFLFPGQEGFLSSPSDDFRT